MNRPNHYSKKGFTLVEVMVASVIMAIGLTTAAICLQLGIRNYDTARKTSLVTQALQDEAERLRLKNWAAIELLPATASIIDNLPASFDETPLSELVANRNLQLTREITPVVGQVGMKHITLTASWDGIDGVNHTRIVQFRYTEGGTSDYYYGRAD
jgi:prepilin-type N-terminal cleavage/methylation domain-containing protein